MQEGADRRMNKARSMDSINTFSSGPINTGDQGIQPGSRNKAVKEGKGINFHDSYKCLVWKKTLEPSRCAGGSQWSIYWDALVRDNQPARIRG